MFVQYECTSPVLAPVGCLQHYTGASGMVQSFNYMQVWLCSSELCYTFVFLITVNYHYYYNNMQDIGTPANLDGVNHLANLNYAACVRMESGYCGIRWAQYPSEAVSFTISGTDKYIKGA